MLSKNQLTIQNPQESCYTIKTAFLSLLYTLFLIGGIGLLDIIFPESGGNLLIILLGVLGTGSVVYLFTFIYFFFKALLRISNIKLKSGNSWNHSPVNFTGTGFGEYMINEDDKKKIETYDGEFKNSVRCGHGKYNFYNKDYYEGNWKDDMMDGEGKYVWKSGHIYQGKFSNGKRHGLGELTLKNGKNYSGVWHLDRLQGKNIVEDGNKIKKRTKHEQELKNNCFRIRERNTGNIKKINDSEWSKIIKEGKQSLYEVLYD